MNERAIWRDRGHRSLVMAPNYTPAGWWECDMWMVTKALYACEFEIKVSVADFKADKAKWKRQFVREPGGQWFEGKDVTHKKHDQLAARSTNGPNRFYFVMPAALGLTASDVPEWAGLMEWREQRYNSGFSRIKEAPTLHREPVKPGVLKHCQSVFYYRYWHLRHKHKIDTSIPDSNGNDYTI
jgi:hypothetical protein